MSGSFRSCPHCQRLTLNQRCDNPDCTGPGARVTMPAHKDACGCGHQSSSHTGNNPAPQTGCAEWRRYPEALHARPCGCQGAWRP